MSEFTVPFVYVCFCACRVCVTNIMPLESTSPWVQFPAISNNTRKKMESGKDPRATFYVMRLFILNQI